MSEFLVGNTCVVGLQWGDEGKGKIVDFLTENAEVVARYCGGANAGHSVRIGNEKYATHLLPVGVFRPGVMSLIFSSMAAHKIPVDMVVQNVGAGGTAEVSFTVPESDLAETLTAALVRARASRS